MTRDEMHDLVLGVAVVALVYAVYQHRRTASATTINTSDQAAIAAAIGSASGDGPDITIPAPIPVQGGQGGYGYELQHGSGFDWSNLFKGVL